MKNLEDTLRIGPEDRRKDQYALPDIDSTSISTHQRLVWLVVEGSIDWM